MPCRHIYEIIGQEICPDCGRYTHEADRAFQNSLHKQYIADGHRDKYQCGICGGTLRVWWDI